MKICAIGDPHGSIDKIKEIPLKDVDLILLTGDIGSANLMRKMFFDNIERKKQGKPEIDYSSSQKKKAFMEAYTSTINLVKYLQKFAPVYTIFGNVESSNYETRKKSKKIGTKLPFLANDLNSLKNVRVLNNRLANFQGVRIGGLEYFLDDNWVREFKPSNYKEELVKSKKQTTKAKKILDWFNSLDILLCHQPPYKVLDEVGAPAPMHWRGKNAGSQTILKYIEKHSPKYVFCGHIHEAKGYKKVGKTHVYNLGVADHKIIEI